MKATRDVDLSVTTYESTLYIIHTYIHTSIHACMHACVHGRDTQNKGREGERVCVCGYAIYIYIYIYAQYTVVRCTNFSTKVLGSTIAAALVAGGAAAGGRLCFSAVLRALIRCLGRRLLSGLK